MSRHRDPEDPAESARLREIGTLLGTGFLRLLTKRQKAAPNPENSLDEVAPGERVSRPVNSNDTDAGAA